MAEKLHCDLCDNVVTYRKYLESFSKTYWEFREINFFHCMRLIFGGGKSSKKLTVCENCIDDFKEFIERKQACKNQIKVK